MSDHKSVPATPDPLAHRTYIETPSLSAEKSPRRPAAANSGQRPDLCPDLVQTPPGVSPPVLPGSQPRISPLDAIFEPNPNLGSSAAPEFPSLGPRSTGIPTPRHSVVLALRGLFHKHILRLRKQVLPAVVITAYHTLYLM